MKTFIAAVVFAILVLGIGLLPAMAQRGSRGDAGGLRSMPGRVLAVNPRAQTADLALYYLAAGPDAPGKVPDEMAQQAAALKRMADQLRQQGKKDRADQLMEQVKKLLSWRELNYTTNLAQTTIIGTRIGGLDKIAKGDKVKLTIQVDGNPRDAEQGELTANVEQLAPQAEDSVERMQDARDKRRTFFTIVGEVVDLKPLTVRAQGREIRIDTSDRFRYVQQVELTPRDVKAGNRVRALVQLGPGPQVRAVRQLLMLGDNADIDFGSDDGR
ncbi:MAG: hypothetical protein ACYDCO_09745 [Armatimonadota bacterium]